MHGQFNYFSSIAAGPAGGGCTGAAAGRGGGDSWRHGEGGVGSTDSELRLPSVQAGAALGRRA